MTECSTHHATFVLERTYPVPTARVFRAWAEGEAKLQWFACHEEWKPVRHDFDFRVGGHEVLHTRTDEGVIHAMDATYHDIVPDARIVYAYAMHVGDARISVSLATVEFEPVAKGTRLTFTEQVVGLDGYDDIAGREEGTRIGLENLGKVLA